MTTATDTLVARLHCEACGAIRPHADDVVLVRRSDAGEDHIWTRCTECDALLEQGRDVLARHAIARLLGIEPDDDALTLRVVSEVVLAADQPFVQQTRQDPWGHLDRDELAVTVKRERRVIESRRGGPCRWCGRTLNSMNDDGTPKTWWPLQGHAGQKAHPGVLCDPCQEFRTDTRPLPAAVTNRDLIAAKLIGWSTHNMTRYVPGLGAAVGLLLWSDFTDPDFDCGDKGFVWVDRESMTARATAWKRGDA